MVMVTLFRYLAYYKVVTLTVGFSFTEGGMSRLWRIMSQFGKKTQGRGRSHMETGFVGVTVAELEAQEGSISWME